MLYTRKGDYGKTGTFGSKKRISKSSVLLEALGTMDEMNSFLGLCKVSTKESGFKLGRTPLHEIVHAVQKNLFIIQAELAGADKTIDEKKVKALESIVDATEKELQPITTFFISGGTELAARFDFARTFARRAERRVVAVNENTEQKIGYHTLEYLNRLSSLFYTLARLSNHLSGITEESPDYK